MFLYGLFYIFEIAKIKIVHQFAKDFLEFPNPAHENFACLTLRYRKLFTSINIYLCVENNIYRNAEYTNFKDFQIMHPHKIISQFHRRAVSFTIC